MHAPVDREEVTRGEIVEIVHPQKERTKRTDDQLSIVRVFEDGSFDRKVPGEEPGRQGHDRLGGIQTFRRNRKIPGIHGRQVEEEG